MPVYHRFFGLLLTILIGLVPLGALGADQSRIAVLELQGKQESSVLQLLSDQVRAGVLEATRGQDVIVMSRENMAVLAKDMGLDLSCIEGACEVETGRNIGAAYVISGSVSKLDDTWLCTIKIHQTDTAALLSTGNTRSKEVVGLLDGISPLVVKLMKKAFGGGGPKAQVQLGGEAVDFGAVAADARAAGGGPASTSTGTAETVLGGGDGDLAAMAAQASAQAAERARTEAAMAAEEARLAKEAARLKAVRDAERKRQAEEAAALKRRMEAERKRQISEARETLLTKAESDMQPLKPLLTGPMTPATKQALQTYLSRYRSAKITVDGTSESVTIPGVTRIDRALTAEAAREKAALAAARQQKLEAEKAALLARAKKDFAAIAPLLEGEVPKEVRPVLEAFVARYEGAKVRVDDVEQTVVIPGLSKVQAKLGGSSSAGTKSIGMKFVAIAAGSFQMGSPSSEKYRSKDETQHRVTLSKSFLMSTTEVTQGQWQAVMGSNPSGFPYCGADCPVEKVTWFDAVKFANALSKKEGLRAAYRVSGKTVSWDKSATGYRLPTEAEWEYAARGGQDHVYSGSSTLSAVGWTRENSDLKIHKVAGKRANAWGLYDMTGNVWEWCWDWKGKYSGSSTDPVGPQSGDGRVIRGGSWYDIPASARVAVRVRITPGSRVSVLGLRLVRTNP